MVKISEFFTLYDAISRAYRAPDHRNIQAIFSKFLHENVMLWVLIRSASVMGLLMSTHNICVCAEVRKILIFLVEKKVYLIKKNLNIFGWKDSLI